MNTKTTQIHPDLKGYGAFIGLDWAQREHVLAIREASGSQVRLERLANKPAALRAWFAQLRQRHPATLVALCIENNRGLLIRELERYEWIHVFAANPATAAGYRRMFAPSGDKSDERDAAALLDLLMTHPQKLRILPRRDHGARVLDELCRARRKAVDGRTKRIEALVDLLRTYYPLAMEMVGEDLSKPIALAFLRRWKNTHALLKARPQTLRKFFHQQRSRSAKRMEERMEALAAAPKDEPEEPLQAVFELRLEELIEAIATANKSIRIYDKAIREQCSGDERAVLFEQLPGAGEVMAPRLLAAFRLVDPQDAEQMHVESGIAPIRLQSGGSLQTCMRRFCGKFLRQTLHEYAGCSVNHSIWAKAFYRHATQVHKMEPQAAKRALAFKWIRVLTACWKNGQAYDEQLYLKRLREKGAPYLAQLEAIA